MVSRTFLTGTLAALSARVVAAGPCRPVSSSAVEVSYSSMASGTASAIIVSSSTETLYTETGTLDTSLTLPTTDVTTSTVVEEITTTTAEGFTTTELTISEATSYQTTETTVTDSESTAASETTATAAETTSTAAVAVPTSFNLVYEDIHGDTFFTYYLQGPPQSSSDVYLGDFPLENAPSATFTYDSESSQLSFNSQTLCVYLGYDSWNGQVKTCSAEANERYTPILCEKPSDVGLKCRMPGVRCIRCPPEIPDCPNDDGCVPTGDVWSQFFAKSFIGGSYLLYFGMENPSGQQLGLQGLEPINLQIYEI